MIKAIDKGLKGRSGIGRSFNLSAGQIRVDPPRDIFAGWAGFVTYCTVQNAILLVPDIRQLRIQLLPQVFKKMPTILFGNLMTLSLVSTYVLL